ncbi:MAG: UDP-N-acetylmuramoyl-tripeptide--D-alanyl-D-alanine ligase [Gammaproteobacteria bacterium]|nr:UDP-N-acetylmuramoyl-tripeptide--D-alanyl-D-alanine ligase [Gammaproteobacteria bacterium]
MSLSEAAQSLQADVTGTDIQFSGCSTDTRTLSSGELFIALRGDNFDGHDFIEQAITTGAVAAMVDRKPENESIPTLFVEDTRRAMGDLAAAWRNKLELPIIAVTGSNGKTTVKEMLAAILSQQADVLSTKGNLNNDIGVPLTLFSLSQEHKYAVIEMGANHSGEIERLSSITRPDVAVITLCAPAHLKGFGSIDGVAKAKAEIYSGLQKEGVAIINADDDYADFWLEKVSDYKRLTFSIENPADVNARNIHMNKTNNYPVFTLSTACAEIQIELAVFGVHNVYNALAAAACCVALNIPLQQIQAGLQSFQAVNGRMQGLAGKNNCFIINDTYNANPASMQAAINTATAAGKPCWLVIGDMGELGDISNSAHRQVGENARAAGVERLYALGPMSKHAADGFGAGAFHFEDMQALIKTLNAELESELTVLIKGSRSMAMEQVVQALSEEN